MAHTFIIFGASGDLTQRKLIPALYHLHRKGRLPEETQIVGFSRTEFSHEQWRAKLRESTTQFDGEVEDTAWKAFAESIYYHPGDIGEPGDFESLKAFLDRRESDASCTRVYYLATAPKFYEQAVEQLGMSGLARQEDCGPRRVVIEKPFGTDLPSAHRLNEAVHAVFDEEQIYRIDHYLGKETVQNLLVLRFANSIFEPLWNRNYIDHVQITVAEEVDVGSRAGYYDTSGVLRDMFQNHLLQLLMVTAMEAPVRYEADLVRDEKVKVLQALRPLAGEQVAKDTVRGRYEGYRNADGVTADSRTATFAAIKLWIDNWRWQGVPFYLRSGKAMSCRTTQIVIQFREPPHMLFDHARQSFDVNRLLIQIQPAEGIQLEFQSKVPDAGMRLQTSRLDFRFARQNQQGLPDAYQRLLLDAMQGEASLFARSDEVELAWSVIDSILESWHERNRPELETYERGMWGPSTSTEWMQSQGRQWYDICPVLH